MIFWKESLIWELCWNWQPWGTSLSKVQPPSPGVYLLRYWKDTGLGLYPSWGWQPLLLPRIRRCYPISGHLPVHFLSLQSSLLFLEQSGYLKKKKIWFGSKESPSSLPVQSPSSLLMGLSRRLGGQGYLSFHMYWIHMHVSFLRWRYSVFINTFLAFFPSLYSLPFSTLRAVSRKLYVLWRQKDSDLIPLNTKKILPFFPDWRKCPVHRTELCPA